MKTISLIRHPKMSETRRHLLLSISNESLLPGLTDYKVSCSTTTDFNTFTVSTFPSINPSDLALSTIDS
jgi:hypothetical protein